MIGLLSIISMMLVGCSDSWMDNPVENLQEGKVTFTISVNVPGASSETRAMDGTTKPTITSLYLVVFGQDHFLREMAQAEEINDFETESEQGVETKFKVTLSSSADPVIVHLIANYDLSAGVPFGSEGQIIGTLETSGNKDVYWQRVEDVTIKPANNDQALAHVIPAPANLKEVPLVRNYAQFQLSNAASTNFKLTRYALVNIPDRGTIAPRISADRFAAYYNGSGLNATCKTYQQIITQNYTGNEPFSSVLNEYDKDDPSTFKWINANNDGIAPTQYVYEYDHSFDADRPLSLLIEGFYNPSSNTTKKTYYKLDIIYQDANNVSHYYHILRNFIYKMNIQSVTGEGYAKPEDALEQPASNNLSGSTLVENFNSISDGTYQLFVDKTSIYVVNTYQVTFKYKLVQMSDNTAVNNNVRVSWDANDVYDDSSTTTTHVFKSNPTCTESNDSEGWRTVTITPNNPSGLSRDLTANIYVAATGGLMRTVKVTLRQPYRMLVEVTPDEVDQTYNYPITVSTFIPDDLPESIFPLTFHYSTANNTIYPQANTDMPVNINKGNGTYDFIKTIRWVDYQALLQVTKQILVNGTNTNVTMRQFDAYFMTNTQHAGTTTVTVKNDFFTPQGDSFTISSTAATIGKISIVGTEYYGKGHDVTLKYTIENAATSVAISITDGSTTVNYNKTTDDNGNVLTTVGTHEVTLQTQTFNGDVKMTIATTRTGANDQAITINNPKKRHILLIPAGSFRIKDTSVLNNYTIVRTDNNGTYNYSWYHAGNYEYPDYHIDGIASGSGQINGGTGNSAGTVKAIEIDATYGGRVQEFTENSKFVFTTYYNYAESYVNANTATEAEYFSHEHETLKKWAVLTIGDICDNWAENIEDGKNYIDLELEFTSTNPFTTQP